MLELYFSKSRDVMESFCCIIIIIILFSILITRRDRPILFVLKEAEDLSLRSTAELLSILEDYRNISSTEIGVILAELKIRESHDKTT